MRKILGIVLILCVAVVSLALFLTYKMWGTGIFPGTLEVSAYLKTPSAEGSVASDTITMTIRSAGQKIGDSGTKIQLTSGRYTLSFEDYSAEYQTPEEQTVQVRPYETTYLSIAYKAKFGYLIIDTNAHNSYYQNYSSMTAEVFLDNESKGFTNVTNYSARLSLKVDASESSHVISFSNIEGYIQPKDQSVKVGNSEIVRITGTYETILTTNQSLYVYFRDNIRTSTLDPSSNTDIDNFYKDIMDDRKTKPAFYTTIIKERERISVTVSFRIAQYVGIFKEDQINTAIQLYHTLLPFGINLTQKGVTTLHYPNQSECILTATIGFSSLLQEQEQSIYRFNQTWVETIPNLSTNLTPAGMGLIFYNTTEVYVVQGQTTPSFESVYVPPFNEYSNNDAWTRGWYSHTFWPSNLYQFIESLRLIL